VLGAEVRWASIKVTCSSMGQWRASKRGSPAQPHATPCNEGNQLLLVHLPLVYGYVRALEVIVIERVVPRDEGRFRRAAGCQPCGQDRRCLFVRLTSKADSRFSPIPPSGVEGGKGGTSAVPICMYARTMLITWFIMMASALWSVKDSPAFISCRRRIRVTSLVTATRRALSGRRAHLLLP